MQIGFLFLLAFVIGLFVGVSATLENSFAQQEISPLQQWKKSVDIDALICKQGYLLLLKTHGDYPLCVLPMTYLKLVDRGFGNYDSSIMDNRPEMTDELLQTVVSHPGLMHHWHEMMQKNPSILMQVTDSWISQIRDDPDLLKNVLGPMTSDPKLRLALIDMMKNHSHMEIALKQNSEWMDSVHHPITYPEFVDGKRQLACDWCPEYQKYLDNESYNKLGNSDRMMYMMHEMWLDSELGHGLHSMMLQNPSHLRYMSEQAMNLMVDSVMDDEDLRLQMIGLLLEHRDFMNTIRHDSPQTKH